jgi:3D (Asp-Asp-Asp) domain-containing protein
MNSNAAQLAMATVGFYGGPVDGNLRSADFIADLKRFQRMYGLVPDGVYGPKTDALLGKKRDAVLAAMGCQPDFQRMQIWQLTGYWIAQGSAGVVPIYDEDSGKLLAKVLPGNFCSFSLEGSGTLPDGRMVNVAGFRPVGKDAAAMAEVLAVADSYGGAAYSGLRLAGGKVSEFRTFKVIPTNAAGWPAWNQIDASPWKTVAADLGRTAKDDPRFKGKGGLVPVGTRAFVLELAGRKLADGSTHDGWVTVNDTGGGIYGAHFDVFCGRKSQYKANPPPARALIWFPASSPAGIDYSLGLS